MWAHIYDMISCFKIGFLVKIDFSVIFDIYHREMCYEEMPNK